MVRDGGRGAAGERGPAGDPAGAAGAEVAVYVGWWKYGLRQTAGPADEPVTLAEARAYLRVDTGSAEDDAAIARMIAMARDDFERLQNRCLVTSTWELTVDCFPARSWWRRYGYRSEPLSPPFPWFERHTFRVPRPPLLAVTSVVYVDEAGATVTLPATEYQVDNR